jgi:hypothetical protein
VGIFASNVVRKNRSSPALASAGPQIHDGCGAASGFGGAVICSQKPGAAAGLVAGAGLVAFERAARGLSAPTTTPQETSNRMNRQASLLGIRS